MADSDSDLSTPPATDDEMAVEAPPPKATKPPPQKKKRNKNNNGATTILSYFEKESSPPPRKKRAPSPPHEPVPEDNEDIAFIVMFRSRFAEAFPPKCPHVGPQDLEEGVAAEVPTPDIEGLLCALLGLVNNRKKPVEKGHYGRALEEAIHSQKSQWPRSWNGINPLHGGRSFNSMTPTDRLGLLKTLIMWSLNQSEVVNHMIKEAYKSRSTKDRGDTNIPLSVQPWGRDGDKRRYFLIEGQDDTRFRVYREGHIALKNVTWWSVAGSIDELRVLAKKLEEEDGTRDAKILSERMINAIPRFEATEEKRRKREYRLARKAAFTRPEPGFSLYEGRTRGKRMKYTFSDEEVDDSDAQSVRRSTRNSGRETSAAPTAPTVTASGRQVRSRATGMYGESLLSGQTTDQASPATGEYMRSEGSEEPERPSHGRSTRAANRDADSLHKSRKHTTYNSADELDEEEDATSWDGGDEDDEEPEQMDLDDNDEEDDSGDESSDADEEPRHLVVRLKYRKGPLKSATSESIAKTEDFSKPGEAPQPVIAAVGPPLTGMDAAQQQPIVAPVSVPTAAAVVPPVQPLPPSPSLMPGISPNGIPPTQEQITLPAMAPAIPVPPPTSDPHTLPSLSSLFHAPTPPYSTQEAPKPQDQPQFPVTNPEAPCSPQSFATTFPVPTPATNWQ